ncbi:hypothetical protein HDU76_009398, partial [Blyttiomyces sp. JEL0837]
MAATATAIRNEPTSPSSFPRVQHPQPQHQTQRSPSSNSLTTSQKSSSASLLQHRQQSARRLIRQESSVPEIIVFPPEEDADEPSISYAPNDHLSGLPNPRKKRVQSCLNATLQLFISLPEMTDDLPVASRSDIIRQFVDTVLTLHCVAEKVATPDMLELDWWRDMAGLPAKLDASNKDEPVSVNASEDDLEDSFTQIEDYERVPKSLLENVLLPCKIGKRFSFEQSVDGQIQSSPAVAKPKGGGSGSGSPGGVNRTRQPSPLSQGASGAPGDASPTGEGTATPPIVRRLDSFNSFSVMADEPKHRGVVGITTEMLEKEAEEATQRAIAAVIDETSAGGIVPLNASDIAEMEDAVATAAEKERG